MNQTINFVIPGLDSNPYSRIIHAIITPIISHLQNSIISHNSISDAVNIHFFLEKSYRETVNIHEGTSIFMSHGIADKGWRDGPKVKDFDYICVSGPLWVEKMIREGIPAGKILMVGYTKLDPIFQGVIQKSTPHCEKQTVLYAPTHTNSEPSSYPAFAKYLKYFPTDLRLLFSPHPTNNDVDKNPTIQQLTDADIVISDCGSLLYEAWALDKPVIFPDWLVKDAVLKYWPKSFVAQIYREKLGYHADNFIHLIQLVYKGLEEGIGKREQEFTAGILPPEFRGKSGEIAAKVFLKIAQSQ